MGQTTSQPIQQTSKPEMQILSRQEAIAALEKADTLDRFSELLFLDSVNQEARKGLDYIPVDGPDLPVDISWLQNNVQICWMSPSAEAGMPHTRAPNVICLPLYWKSSNLMETLKHEAIHVDQRLHPNKWIRWCIKNGWTIVKDSTIPERWLKRCRLNPDTCAYRFWAYQNRWVPLPLYEREDRPTLRDIRVRWWDMKTGELLHSAPSEVQEHIQGIANPEHPFEIAAYKLITL